MKNKMAFLPFSIVLDLRKELDGTAAEVLTWGCNGYGDNIKQWSDTRDTQVGAVVRVRSADEAATVVRFATLREIPFTVKGGGYSTTGASIVRGGIVLDLSDMRNIQVQPAAQVIIAQGGAIWEDIDVAAAQHQLAVVGSTLNHIGVAGATLGGGYGWLTGQYGLAMDNLLWVKIILADGTLITTSEDLHPDLFWAIRGAGQSFGVVVEFGFRAHKQDHPIFAGTLLFTPEMMPAIVEFANTFERINDGKQGLWFGFTMLPSMTQCSILVVVFYNGSQKAAEAFFSPLFSLNPVVNKTQCFPYDGLNGILNTMDTMTRCVSPSNLDIPYPKNEGIGPRKSLLGSNVTLPLDANFIRSIYNDYNDIVNQYPQTRDSRLLFELLPNAQIMKVPNGATAFANRGPYYNVSSLFRWHDSHLDQRICSLQSKLMNKIAACGGIARKPGYDKSKYGTGLYANYAAHDAPPEAIFGDNLGRLQELKRKYDPKNTFRRWNIMKDLGRSRRDNYSKDVLS